MIRDFMFPQILFGFALEGVPPAQYQFDKVLTHSGV